MKRSRGEAERLLRAVLEECQNDPGTKIFTQKCKDMSECRALRDLFLDIVFWEVKVA